MMKSTKIPMMTLIACSFLLVGAEVSSPVGEGSPAAEQSVPAESLQAQATTYMINWYVIAGGGGAGNSAGYALNGTVGQTATGQGTSASYSVLHGYWQNFTTGCCIGRTGNVDLLGSFPTDVDSSDLGALVNFLFSPPGTVVLPCVPEADVDAQGGANPVDSSDLGALVAFLFASPPGSVVLPDCP